ncbi:MAG: SDR family NAD(P)-dependent oxidoreductase [Alphaproteobacteria bacterium]
MKLQGRVAVITGSARGIGLAHARRLAKEGAAIVINDLKDSKGEEAADAIRREGGVAFFIPGDVTNKAEMDALMDEAVAKCGRLDICVANAGINITGPFLDIREEDFDRVMAVNVKGVFLSCQAAAKRMIRCGNGGSIITMASTNATVVNPDQIPYPTSKGGVVLLTRVMAIALADHGIRANVIAPGSINAPMLHQVIGGQKGLEVVYRRTALRRLAEVEEIANVCAFLASDDASYITGQTIYVDGGRLALNLLMPERQTGGQE